MFLFGVGFKGSVISKTSPLWGMFDACWRMRRGLGLEAKRLGYGWLLTLMEGSF